MLDDARLGREQLFRAFRWNEKLGRR